MKTSTIENIFNRKFISSKTADTENSGRWIRQFVGTLTASICLSLIPLEALASFSFTKIADNQSDFSSVSSSPAINDIGTVAFEATSSGGSQGIYTNNGGAITTIIDTNALPVSVLSNFPSPFFTLSQNVDINNNGTVAFLVNFNMGSSGTSCRLITTQGGSFTTRGTDSRSAIGNGGSIVEFNLNNNEELAYQTEDLSLGNFIFTDSLYISKPNQPSIKVATAFYQVISPFASGSFSSIGGGVINNQSQITFYGSGQSADGQVTGIYRGNVDSFNFLIDAKTPNFGTNDNGDIVLSDGKTINLFNNTSNTLTTIADGSSVFTSFSNAAINNNQHIAFEASLANGVSGIFTGADPVGNKVIATGDPLFNSTVTNLTFSRKSLNNLGQIVFYAELADGTKGIFVATESPDRK
ncbi:MAG: hypothetical protein PUP91_17115 [Rhizonema sp. PD37]|nr:hypothetical protein [Rhizonema sp. PD37]